MMQAIKIVHRAGQSLVGSRLARHMGTIQGIKLYELRIYHMKPEYFRESLDLLAKFWSVRTAYSKAVGSWMTEIGGICETVHLWEYENLKDRFQARQKVAEDQIWQKEFLPKFFAYSLQMTNMLLVALPGTEVKKDFEPAKNGAFYELQNCGSYSPPVLHDKLSSVVAQFSTIYGPTPNEILLLRHTDPDKALAIAAERRRTQGVGGFSRLMVPSAWSALQ